MIKDRKKLERNLAISVIVVGVLAFIMSIGAVLGYAIEFPRLYQWRKDSGTPMALSTAFLFSVLSVCQVIQGALLLAQARRNNP